MYIYASILLCNVLYMYWAFDTKVKFKCIILRQLRNTVAWTILKERKHVTKSASNSNTDSERKRNSICDMLEELGFFS